MPAAEFDPVLALDNPYVGLRPFESYESLLFFGREAHTRELVERLAHNRFLAVIGSSGSGKSSLVRAGLLPVLQRGYLVGTSSRWRIAIMRPGSAPLQELTQALAAREVFDSEDPAALRELLGRSSYGLVNAVRNAKLRAGENLLLVVDQFEELFRFAKENRHPASKAEAALFVSLLIEATEAFNEPIYVVLTMRSEFLGYCTHFPGLAEALNRSQYLIPRLTLNQRQATIERPVGLAGADVSPALVQRLLTDAGDDPDQLPVLQHALMRTFDHSSRESEPRVLSIEDYEEVSKTGSALDQHAAELYDSLSEDTKAWARRLFRCITTTIDGSAVRRPARLRWIYAVTGARTAHERAQVNSVVELYSARENSLLFSTTGKALGPRSIIDISHESLIRKWKLLGEWVSAEARSAEWLRDVSSCVKRQADYTEDPDLSYIESLQRDDHWNSAWAAQYIPKREVRYARICEFLAASRKAQDEAKRQEEERQHRELETAQALARHEQERRKLLEQKRRLGWLALGLMALAVIGLSYAVMRLAQERNRADREANNALEQRGIAERAEVHAKALENAANARAAEVALLTAKGREREQLEKELSDYKRQAEVLDKKAKEAPAVKATTDDWSAAQIRTLQDEVSALKMRLNQAARVRDLKLDVQQQGPPPEPADKEAAVLRERIQKVEADNQRLLTTLGQQQQQLRQAQTSAPAASPVPAFYPLIVPQNSWFVHPANNPKFGVIIEDLRRRSSATAKMFVFSLPSPLEPKAPIIDNEKAVSPKLNELIASNACPSPPGHAGPVTCFLVRKKDATRDIQRLGTAPIGQTSFAFYAMGWQQNATGTDVLSVAAVAEGAAQAHSRALPVAAGKWNTNTSGQRVYRLGDNVALHLAALSTDDVATIGLFSTNSAILAASRPISIKDYQSLKPAKGQTLEPESYLMCEIGKGQTCWVTLPSGKTLGIKADDLGYKSGKVNLSFYYTGP